MVKENDTCILTLQVHRVEDILFKSSIPLSCKKLLNDEVEEFIVQEAENLPVKNNITLLIRATGPPAILDDKIAAMVHAHFAYCRSKTEKQLKDILKLGWRSLFIACIFLIAMFFITRALGSFLPEGGFLTMLSELFIILGWVALWRPADLLLYEWRPFKRKARLYAKLSECDVQVQKVVGLPD